MGVAWPLVTGVARSKPWWQLFACGHRMNSLQRTDSSTWTNEPDFFFRTPGCTIVSGCHSIFDSDEVRRCIERAPKVRNENVRVFCTKKNRRWRFVTIIIMTQATERPIWPPAFANTTKEARYVLSQTLSDSSFYLGVIIFDKTIMLCTVWTQKRNDSAGVSAQRRTPTSALVAKWRHLCDFA